MKKPIHLYIFVVLSFIASVMRIKGSFFTSFNEATYRADFKGMEPEVVDNLTAMAKAGIEFSTNSINKLLGVLLLALLLVVIFFLFKKANERASYAYLAYLFLTLVYATYSYVGSLQVVKAFQTADLYTLTKTTSLVAYGFNIVLFAIYFGLTIFFLLRKPKNHPTVEQNTTDI